jgi:CHAD domain-containing protein
LGRRLDALREHLADALAGHERAIHQARVATRRLREIVPLVVDARSGRGERLVRRLRKLTRALGPVRELDVALGLLDTRAAGRPEPGVVAMRAHLTEARKAAFTALTDAWDAARATRLLDRLGRLTADRRRSRRQAVAALPKRLRRALARRVLDRARVLGVAVAAAGAILIVERVHDVRIATKRLRYALELAGELRLVRTAALVASLRTVQDILGELHDLDVLRGRCALVLREVPADSIVAREVEAIAASIDADVRVQHARYLRTARGLARLTDRVLDRVTPCLDPSTSISSATPSPKTAGRRGPTTRNARSPTTARKSGGGRPPGSRRSGRGPT